MSTHGAIGVEMEDGSIVGCYVHYDGGSMTPRIVDYLRKHTTTDLAVLITQAQSSGGMRCFHSPSLDEHVPRTEFLDDNEPYVIDEANFFEDHMGTFAWYLVNYKHGSIESRTGY
mgnify:CR=1 FL=1